VTPITYHEAAEEELLNEIGYLESKVRGLGRRFLTEVKKSERVISDFPESGDEIRPGIRQRTLHTFRYSLVYSLEQHGVLILAVAHHRRRPGYWIGRATRD
jgi:plasmid stabilization system protein ParE